jgi:hypothetical protein
MTNNNRPMFFYQLRWIEWHAIFSFWNANVARWRMRLENIWRDTDSHEKQAFILLLVSGKLSMEMFCFVQYGYVWQANTHNMLSFNRPILSRVLFSICVTNNICSWWSHLFDYSLSEEMYYLVIFNVKQIIYLPFQTIMAAWKKRLFCFWRGN